MMTRERRDEMIEYFKSHNIYYDPYSDFWMENRIPDRQGKYLAEDIIFGNWNQYIKELYELNTKNNEKKN